MIENRKSVPGKVENKGSIQILEPVLGQGIWWARSQKAPGFGRLTVKILCGLGKR